VGDIDFKMICATENSKNQVVEGKISSERGKT